MLILGKQLKILRETHGISQADLANAIHVDLKAVKNWEGDLTNPDLKNLCRLSDFFHVSIDELAGRIPSHLIDVGYLSDEDLKSLHIIVQEYTDTCRRRFKD